MRMQIRSTRQAPTRRKHTSAQHQELPEGLEHQTMFQAFGLSRRCQRCGSPYVFKRNGVSNGAGSARKRE